MKAVKKSIFSILFLITTTLFTLGLNGCQENPNKGAIVILNGTSSAGKSSISKILKEKYLFKYSSHDNCMSNLIAEWVEKRILKETGNRVSLGRDNQKLIYENYKKIMEELNLNEENYDWEIILSQKKQVELINKAFLEMLEKAKRYACKSKNVIVDIMFDEESALQTIKEKFQDFDTYFVLAYCPFDILAQRVEERNIDGGAEKRTLVQALNQFSELYKARENEDEINIGELSKEDFNRVCELVKKEFKLNDQEEFNEETNFDQAKYNKFINNLKEELGFTNEEIESITITPRLPYDLIINTGEKTPKECAKEINKLVSVIKEWQETLRNEDVITFKAYNTPLVDKELMAKLRNIWKEAYSVLFTNNELEKLAAKGISRNKVIGLSRNEIKELIKGILKGEVNAKGEEELSIGEIKKLYGDIVKELVEEFLDEDWPEDEGEFDSTRGKGILKAGSNRIIAFKNDEPIGYISFVNDFVDYDGNIKNVLGPDEKWIEPIMVHPSAHGLGLGRKLTFSILKLFPNTKRIILVTGKDNEGARAFYRRIGFTEQTEESYGYDIEESQLYEWINPDID